jgi:hypothetical protein
VLRKSVWLGGVSSLVVLYVNYFSSFFYIILIIHYLINFIIRYLNLAFVIDKHYYVLYTAT